MLPHERIHELHAAAVSLGLAPGQSALLEGIAPAFIASLPDLPNGSPLERLLLTLCRLNSVEHLADGTIPFEVWLRNAARLTGDDLFTEALAELTGGVSVAPRVPRLRSPHPEADDPRVRKIRALSAEKVRLATLGESTEEIVAQILELKRQQRSGPAFAPNDDLASSRFQLLELVGRGGIGCVWRAIDHLRGELVAVKVLHAHHGPEVQFRFRRGARCMSKLNHPNVVRVVQSEGVELLSEAPRWFFVMDYLPGGNLKSAVLTRRLTPEEAMRCVIEAGAGLQHAHERGMVHRDVTPDNILLGEDGIAQLTDFDLVRAPDTTGLTGTEQTFGKFLYAAPETFGSAKDADARADVYALGMTAIFALHGRELPADAVGERERFLAELTCSERVRTIVRRAVAWSRDERYPTVAALCSDLEQALRRPAVTVERKSSADAQSEQVGQPTAMQAANRVFLTEFDRITYSQVGWTAGEVDEIRSNLERKLKLLGLVKGHVLVPASHLLESDLARELVLGHPALFSSGIIVPALRSDFESCEAFLDGKLADADTSESALYRGPEQREMARLIDREARIERWDVTDASSWFKARLLSDVDDDKSLLRSSLRNAGLSLPSDFRARVAETPVLSRGATYRIARDAGSTRLWGFLCDYADFVYYLGGARAVRSEGVLPQENLVDFSTHELIGRRTRLSELEIFFKLFVDVVKAATSTHFPVDFLDAMTIDDVIELHTVAVSTQFVERYNLIQAKTKEGLSIHDPERLVLLMDELDEFERDLHHNMETSIERELPDRLRRRRTVDAGRSILSLPSLLIPYHEPTVGPQDIVVSGLQVAARRGLTDAIDHRIRDGVDTCQVLVDHSHLVDRPVLLAFVDKLKTRYAQKLIGPPR